jgi:peptidyl-prolyl cis-trans isomerase SurA
MRHAAFMLALSYLLSGGVVIDRIAAVAGKHVIKLSDIERDLRLTAFLNRQALDLSPAAKRKSADRLIDQTIIRDEIATEGYSQASDADANAMLAQIRKERYGSSAASLRQALSRYGLTENELHDELRWQLTVLRFIDERFRPGVLVTEDQIRTYYNQHLAELKRQHPRDSSFEALQSSIRELLEGQQINEEFENWLAEARKQVRIEYRQEAFQ